jgi:putative transposase
MDYKKISHAVYHCDYHLVLPTKYRRKILNEGIFAYVELKLKEITEHYPYIIFKKANSDKDHIHLLVSIPPTMSVGKAVRIIKSNISKSMKSQFPFLKKVYWGTESVWSGGYFASTIGIDEKIIEKYISMQGREDSGQAKLV